MTTDELKILERYIHFLNNHLMVISGGAEIIGLDDLSNRAVKYLDALKEETKKISDCSQMLAKLYSNYNDAIYEFNLSQLLFEVVAILRFSLKRNFNVNYTSDVENTFIFANPVLIRDSLLKLFLSVLDPQEPVDFNLRFIRRQLWLKSNLKLVFLNKPQELNITEGEDDNLLKIVF